MKINRILVLVTLLISIYTLEGGINKNDDFKGFSLGPNYDYYSNYSGAEGFALAYSFPGQFCVVGQLNLAYINKNQDAFHLNITYPYIYAGMNKYLNSLELYINIQAGTVIDNTLDKYQSYNMGLSKIYNYKDKHRYEVALDFFLHHGYTDYFDNPYMKGTKISFNYAYNMTKKIVISVNTGAGFTWEKYGYDSNGSEYIDYSESESGIYSNTGWDYRFIIPVNLTLSYTF